MNMILHGYPTAEIWHGNTLADPGFKEGNDHLKTFDFAVANPPFSAKAWTNGLDPVNDRFHRLKMAFRRQKTAITLFTASGQVAQELGQRCHHFAPWRTFSW